MIFNHFCGCERRNALWFRHCERSEAIHIAVRKAWIASSRALLAMTAMADAPGP
jgi:hypothetical protein